MAEFFELSNVERLEALNAAASSSGRLPHLLEKDIWVVWSLRHLFDGPHAGHLVFKGGTSLSKAYGVIRRFSEDVDLTYDIRAIAGDLIGDADAPLPASKSQEKKWSKEIRARLAEWVASEIVPRLKQDLEQQSLPASVRAEDDKVFIDYVPLIAGTGYVTPAVMLEFGARSTGEPSEPRQIQCDAAAYLPMLVFPTATPQVMRAERTFWEKATAIHVFCAQGTFRGGERFARHWHDVARLDTAGFVDAAIADTALGKAVADHKRIFFAEKSPDGELVDYHAAVSGCLQLVPDDGALATLASDYQHMVDDGLFLDDAEPFEVLLERCRIIQQKANVPSSPVDVPSDEPA
ncbi:MULTISPECIES: nucleotidyl transferase AbiEii/AbiGii toxin family protein [unclassified Undibacterium]|uniref:nucleotidyl transferase AbiEii/AbiGii toxin family protein n=1 Tax=unclassified Undibacterium TaxID=2630295 RepID=UPI002AC9560E|nr:MULTISPECIES: nucleotidyl transferase AbiEii/AbiGii toxin family protein [unclassified Undibacterium]MEB0139703.1 nucleotidyl transferase AbiEii/AbiGii toxin family protein [Undibacterium sp. CCC2.1]MEB0172584.1 nucleotidyl transferase AbiEii/AbiGii toxin family protein [Undibacterium sp. CCC1.1]MEB0176320.1 nucleotidyl transferase AbiEii/AbiGii toxin family protein [Undibacterium sp. CCC3.4]MEB0215654.1 nucleotidyl transferase AbiEii/AbiGii toxin family protein [Undibacterium sp. 5I2]WPX42